MKHKQPQCYLSLCKSNKKQNSLKFIGVVLKQVNERGKLILQEASHILKEKEIPKINKSFVLSNRKEIHFVRNNFDSKKVERRMNE